MNAFMGSARRGFSVKCFRFVVWLLICTFLLPVPVAVNAAPNSASSVEPWNRHVHERLNSPERARAIEEAARLDAAARE